MSSLFNIMMPFNQDMNKNVFNILTLLAVTVFLSFLSGFLLNTDDLVVNTLIDEYTQEQIEGILNFKKKWQWLGHLLTPLLLLIKVGVIAAIIDIGCFLFEKEIKYKKLFNIVVRA